MAENESSSYQDQRRKQLVSNALRFAEVLSDLSTRFKGAARNLTLSGGLAALLLDWIMHQTWQWSSLTTTLVALFLFMPSLVVGWAWYILSEASGLPTRLLEWFANAKAFAGALAERPTAEASSGGSGKGRFSDLKSLGGLAYEITSFGMDVTGLISILGGSLSIANPVYLIVLVVSVVLIALLDLLALISLFVFVF